MTTTITASAVFEVREFMAETAQNATPGEVVAFYDSHSSVIDKLADEGDSDALGIRLTAERHYDEMEKTKKLAAEMAAQQKAQEPRLSHDDWQKQNRQKLAFALRANGHEAAAEVLMFLGEIHPHQAAEAMDYLGKALKAGGACRVNPDTGEAEDWTKCGWAVFHKKLRPLAEKAEALDKKFSKEEAETKKTQDMEEKAAQQADAEQKAMYFLSFLLNALSSLRNDRVSNDIIRGAEMTLARSKPANEWPWYTLAAVDRLIGRGEIELANESEKAEDLITRLREEVQTAVNRHREANRLRQEDKRARQKANQASRAADCRAMRGTNPGVAKYGKGKVGKRAAHDPGRKGK